MKYKKIIQELKESQDPNVLVFLNDVGNIRRLSRKQQKDILARLHEPGITDILVKSFIPTIVRIAYANSRLTSSLSFLDLVNEFVGILDLSFQHILCHLPANLVARDNYTVPS